MRLTAKHEVSLSVAMGDEKLRRTDMSETDLRRAGNMFPIGVEQSEEQEHLSEAVTSMSVTKNMNEAKLSEEEKVLIHVGSARKLQHIFLLIALASAILFCASDPVSSLLAMFSRHLTTALKSSTKVSKTALTLLRNLVVLKVFRFLIFISNCSHISTKA